VAAAIEGHTGSAGLDGLVDNAGYGLGCPAGVAAATITRALTARRPRAVYLSGKDSRRLAILSGLPAPVLDMARRRVFRLPAPGFLAS